MSHGSLRKIIPAKVFNIIPLCICVFNSRGSELVTKLQINSILDHRTFLFDNGFRSRKPAPKFFQYVSGGFLERNSGDKIPFEGVSLSATGEEIIGEKLQ